MAAMASVEHLLKLREPTRKGGGGGGGGGVIERDPDDSEVDGLTEVSCNGACVTLTETEGACREVE